MKSYHITYLVTGGKRTDWVELEATDIMKAMEEFERIAAENWKTFESRYAITEIKERFEA